jgi:hypothetical protein
VTVTGGEPQEVCDADIVVGLDERLTRLCNGKQKFRSPVAESFLILPSQP